MLLGAFFFSLMGVSVKLVGPRIPSQQIVLARGVITLLLSYAAVRAAGLSPWGHRKDLLLLRGLFGFLGLSAYFFALTQLPLAEATLLQYTNPLFAALLAWAFLREKIGVRLLAALFFSLVGTLLIVRPGAFMGEGRSLPLLPTLMALTGAFFSGAAYVTIRKLGQSDHPLVIVFYLPLVVLPATSVTVWNDLVWPRGREWWFLGGVGVATQLAQVFMTKGLKLLPAGRATSIGYVQVAMAAGWSFFFFDETLTGTTLTGCALIMAGTALAVRHP